MTHAKSTKTSPDPRASLWPWGIALGLAAVVGANAIMISIAVSHPSAPADPDHYARALAFDDEIAAREASKALGWTMQLEPCEVTAEGGCELRLELRDADGHPLEGLSVQVEAQRHDSEAYDQSFTLEGRGPGVYAAPWPAPRRGLWALRFRAEASATDKAQRVPWLAQRERFIEFRPPTATRDGA